MTKDGMRILIAPDKFKGTLSAREVSQAIAAGLADVLPGAKIEAVPMADGGEGTAEVISEALGGAWIVCNAHDPLGRDIKARYGWLGGRKIAGMGKSEGARKRRVRAKTHKPQDAQKIG